MLHLLYGQSHAYLDRLWRGHSLITTNVQTHVQIHPELRVAYTETTLSIFNEDQDSNHKVMGLRLSAGNVPQEAIYTISVPEGSICTKLSLWVNGEERTFTTKEFDLLTFLASHPNHVYSKEELFREIWDMESVGDIATVTVHIKKIREKIELDTSKPQYIETIWGVGYRFKV